MGDPNSQLPEEFSTVLRKNFEFVPDIVRVLDAIYGGEAADVNKTVEFINNFR